MSRSEPYEFKNGAVAKEFFYRKEFGSFYFYGGFASMSFMSDEVAICYDKSTFTIMKHGAPDKVSEWLVATKKKTQDSDIGQELVKDLVMIQSNQWDVEELNWLLACTGSLESFLKKHALLSAVPRGE